MEKDIVKKKPSKLLLYILLALTAVSIAVCLIGIKFCADKQLNRLITDVISRSFLSVFLIVFVLFYENVRLPLFKFSPKALLWCLPCFAVAVVNFPFSALLQGLCVIEKPQFIWLEVVNCLFISITEELIFRALLLDVTVSYYNKDEKKKNKLIWAVVVSSAAFGLFHLVNLGAGIGVTLLQVVYTFLIGAMLAVTLLKTGNIFICIAIHAVFDFGGGIINYLGSGVFQDTVFWILTVAVGLLCGIHIFVSVLQLQKND